MKVIEISSEEGKPLLTASLYDEVIAEFIIALVLHRKIPKQHLIDICERYDVINSVLPKRG